MNNINNFNPTVFNGKCSKRYSFDTSEKIEKELDIITSAMRYSRITDTNQPILQTNHLLAMTLLVHLILA